MIIIKSKLAFFTVIFLLLAFQNTSHGRNFSCPYGTQASCLDYGDKVCNQLAKCVDDDATCFSPYTCGLNNEFVCKSKFDELVDEYEDVLYKNRSMVNEYDDLRAKYNNLVDSYNELSELTRRDSSTQTGYGKTFKGYRCTDDCSGHIAGYSWAKQKGLTHPSQCGGNSISFIEGCLALFK